MTSPETETGPVQGTPLLNAALAAFQLELPHVEANETGDAGSYQYKYAGLGSVSKKILPLLAKHGLSFTAAPTVTDAGKFVLRYRLLHESGQELGGEYPLSGGNAQAQGSAITYARRYSLLAATGVSPDQDDDDAAATQQKATEFPSEPTELDSAKQRVLAAWNFQFGDFVQPEVERHYREWSKGGALTSADAAELRRYAGYLSNLPKADAGSDPTDPPATTPDEHGATSGARDMTTKQRGRVFAELTQRYPDRQDQLTFLRSVLGRELTSRSEINFDDAKLLIDVFESESEPAT